MEGDEGVELRQRLTGKDDEGFRSAISECMVCWYLAGVLRLQVEARPRGRGNCVVDLCIRRADGDIAVEVKAPFKERPEGAYVIDDSIAIERCLRDAAKQFGSEGRNMLVLVPRLLMPVFHHRDELTRALFGHHTLSFRIDKRTGTALDEPTPSFLADGAFLGGKNLRKALYIPGAVIQPQHTRIGAVLTIEERVVYGVDATWIEHDVLVAHNPNAVHGIPQKIWGGCPQFVPEGDVMVWTDGWSHY